MSKRSLWEQKGSPKPESSIKVSWCLSVRALALLKKKKAVGWVGSIKKIMF